MVVHSFTGIANHVKSIIWVDLVISNARRSISGMVQLSP
jgi:hypothetical protein